MSIRLRALALLGALSLLGAGCLSIHPLDGAYACKQDVDCPSGYYCEQHSQSCWKKGDELQEQPDLAGLNLTGRPADGPVVLGDMARGDMPPVGPDMQMLVPVPSLANSQLSITVAAPPLVADGTTQATVTVTVNDSAGKGFKGATITLTDADARDVYGAMTGTTDGQGSFTTTLQSDRGGTKTVNANVQWTANGQPGSFALPAAMLSFAQLPSLANSTFTIVAAQTANPLVGNGSASAGLLLQVNDKDAAAVGGVTVAIEDGESGTHDFYTPGNGQTDKNGQFNPSVTTDLGETKMVKAKVSWKNGTRTDSFEIPLAGTLTFIAVAEAKNSTIGLVTPVPGNLTQVPPVLPRIAALASQTMTINLTVEDANMLPIPNAAVSLIVSSVLLPNGQPGSSVAIPNGQDTLACPGGVAQSNGSMQCATTSNGTLAATFSSTWAGQRRVSATITLPDGKTTITKQADAWFDGIPSLGNSAVSVQGLLMPSILWADGSTAGSYSIALNDQNNYPVATTGVNLTIGSAQQAIVTPSANPLTGAVTCTYQGAQSVFATVKWTIDTIAGSFPSNITSSSTLSFVPFPAKATSAISVTSSNVAADGFDSTTIKVVVKDGNGAIIANAPVTLYVSESVGTDSKSQNRMNNVAADQVSLTTNGSGLAQATLNSKLAGTKTLTADLYPPPPAAANDASHKINPNSQIVTFDGIPDSGQTTVTLSPTNATMPANGNADGASLVNFAVKVLDINGVAVNSPNVKVTLNCGSFTCTPTSATTQNGTVTGTIKSTAAGTAGITAKVDWSAVDAASTDGSPATNFSQTSSGVNQVTFVAVPNPGTTTTVAALTTGTTALANNHDTWTITTTVRDYSGALMSGVGVAFTDITGGGGSLSFGTPSSSTPQSGVVTTTVSSTVAGTKTIRATITPSLSNSTVSQTVNNVVFAAPKVSSLTFTSGVSSTMASPFSVTVSAKDASGQLLTNSVSLSLSIAATAGGAAPTLNPATPTAATTNGVATFNNITASGYDTTHTYQLTVSAGPNDTTSGVVLNQASSSFNFSATALNPAAPIVSMDGSDATVNWTLPNVAATCTLQRSSDGGNTWATPATLIACTSPSSTCRLDPFLFLGTYLYRIGCSLSGQPVQYSGASAAAQPSVELCGTTHSGDSVTVNTFNSAGADKVERTISANAGLATAYGIAVDPSNGDIYVAPRDNVPSQIRVFSRLANDPDPTPGERVLNLNLESSTSLQPIGVAVLGSEVIVAMSNSPWIVAGYSKASITGTSASPSTIAPNWYLRGLNGSTATATQLHAPLSVTVDTAQNNIIVGNSSGTITIFSRAAITATNHDMAPTRTVTASTPRALAVDPVGRQLFIADGNGIYSVNADTGASQWQISGANTKLQTPYGIAFLPANTGGGLLYVLNRTSGIITVYPSTTPTAGGNIAPNPTLTVPTFVNAGDGLAICNQALN